MLLKEGSNSVFLGSPTVIASEAAISCAY